MPPQPKSNATTVPADVQVARMAGQLAWCMADSSLIKQQLLDFGLDPESAQAAIAALSTQENQTAITQLHDSFISSTFGRRHSHVGHYIKTSTQPNSASSDDKNHANISVMRNTTTNQVEIIIKPQGERKENTSYFEGTSKRATKSVKLALNPEGLLTVSPVMAIKANDNVDAKSVSDELHAVNALPTDSCLFVSGGGKRENSVRHYQANKGVTVIDFIQDKQNQDQQKFVQMALQYMDQVGSQLSALHEKGAAHFDCKPQNILYDENSRQFTVIDIPEQQYDPCVEDPQQASELSYTPGYTSPPSRPRYAAPPISSGFKSLDTIFYSATIPAITHLGHVNDSYAYLRGLYEIAAAIPDTQA